MEYRQLGKSELRVSAVGLGGNTFGPPRLDRETSICNIHRALELGINFIDTAYIYCEGKSEEFVGDALKGRRDDAIVATKFHVRDLGEETPRQRIMAHCAESLRRLSMDHIDLYQIHFPNSALEPEEVLEPLNDLVQQGKVRYIGECNYSGWRHADASATSRRLGQAEFVSAQNHYSLVRRQVELELLPFCRTHEIGFIPYFPLAGGSLTEKYKAGEPPPEGTRGAGGSPLITRLRSPRAQVIAEELKEFARERGHTLGELAIAWLLARPEVSVVLTGTSNPEQVEANAKAAGWSLTPQEKELVDQIAAWDGSSERIELE